MASRFPSQTGHKRSYHYLKKRDCTTASLYKAPAAGDVIDSMKPLTVSWDTTCFPTNPQTIDLRLYAPYETNVSARRLQIYEEVPYAPGSYQVELSPRWWKDNATVQLQFSIQESGNPLASYYGTGPIFTATYTDDGSKSDKTDLSIIDSGYTWVKNIIKSLSGGQIAGAVIGILLFIALVVGGIFYIRRSRTKQAEKSKRFSQMVDKRMSTISHDWSSISPSAAQAAIRNSMAVYGRPSGDMSFQSSLSINNHPGNTVGTGLRPQRERSGPRVSFAPESVYSGRPSSAARGSVATSNLRFNMDDAPPVPTRKASDNMTLSPTQAAGAFALSPHDVDARASQYNQDMMPALQLMRESDISAEPMLSPKEEAPLPPVPAATSNIKSPMGMMPMLESSMSPDALMRGYASNKQGTIRRTNSLSVATGSASSVIAYPSPARTLYTPQTPTRVDNNPFRKSMAPTVASAYSGVEDEVSDQPPHPNRV